MSASTQTLRTAKGERIAIIDGLRTPFAKQATYFHGVPALDMGKMVVQELITRSNIDPKLVEQLVFGQVVQMPAAPNIAREIVLGTNLPVSTDAFSVSRACATSFQSTVSIAEAMMAGNINVGIAGGADSSSVLPIGVSRKLAHALVDLNRARTLGARLKIFKRLSFKDLLPVPPAIAEYSTGLSMGDTAEQMAKTHQISRADQDKLAHRSHSMAHQAWEEGKLSGEVMVAHAAPYTDFLERDNTVRADSKLEGYSKLRPVFDRKHGSVTAANSTALTDGASAVIMM